MKISNSKKQLAKIISENGGWREGGMFSAQDQDGEVFFYTAKPTRSGGWWLHDGELCGVCIVRDEAMPNWHQTILSRDEYLHLCPTLDADGMPSEINNLTQVGDTDVVELKPTIAQLAAEYRNRQDYAERKQQEADEAKAEAEAKLAELVAAGKALGLVVRIAAPEKPTKPYTGKFYNNDIGSDFSYGDEALLDQICDGCGKRLGQHIGRRCPNA